MSGDTLILVHVLARHGDRCPDAANFYPNDPHKKEEFLPYGVGMLTNLGKKNMYNLGKHFRERYDDYLGDLYLPEYLDTWTSDYIRTKASAQLLLAGLFPPNEELRWNKDLNWQPIHTNNHPFAQDDLLLAIVRSEKCVETYYKLFETDIGKNVMKKYEDIIPYLQKHTGLKKMYPRFLALVYDGLKTESEFGLNLPEWTKEVYPGILGQLYLDEVKLHTVTKEVRRYVCGELFKKILLDTKNKINKKSKCKMHMYVAHDVNIVHVLGTLGLWFDHFIKYGASLTFEVHRINNKYGIKLFYKKHPDEDFELMTWSNGETVMWLDDFEKLVDDLWSD